MRTLDMRRIRCKRRRVLRRVALGARASVSRSGVRLLEDWRADVWDAANNQSFFGHYGGRRLKSIPCGGVDLGNMDWRLRRSNGECCLAQGYGEWNDIPHRSDEFRPRVVYMRERTQATVATLWDDEG